MPEEEITSADFTSVDWQSVIVDSEAKTCDAFSDEFFSRARAADDPTAQAVFQLLGNVTSMMFRLDDKLQPFDAMIRMGGRRSAILDDFTEGDLGALQ